MNSIGYDNPNTIPLTAGQKSRLIVDCVPFFCFVLLLLFYVTVLPRLMDSPPIAFFLFLSLVVVVVGLQAVQRFRDLASGVAVVQEDVLERSWSSSGGKKTSYFGEFEQLGTQHLIASAHFQSHNGMRYRVIYSPVSKIVWELEPLN